MSEFGEPITPSPKWSARLKELFRPGNDRETVLLDVLRAEYSPLVSASIKDQLQGTGGLGMVGVHVFTDEGTIHQKQAASYRDRLAAVLQPLAQQNTLLPLILFEQADALPFAREALAKWGIQPGKVFFFHTLPDAPQDALVRANLEVSDVSLAALPHILWDVQARFFRELGLIKAQLIGKNMANIVHDPKRTQWRQRFVRGRNLTPRLGSTMGGCVGEVAWGFDTHGIQVEFPNQDALFIED